MPFYWPSDDETLWPAMLTQDELEKEVFIGGNRRDFSSQHPREKPGWTLKGDGSLYYQVYRTGLGPDEWGFKCHVRPSIEGTGIHWVAQRWMSPVNDQQAGGWWVSLADGTKDECMKAVELAAVAYVLEHQVEG